MAGWGPVLRRVRKVRVSISWLRKRPYPDPTTALARALFDVGLTTVGPDDLDNRQLAERLLAGGYVRVLR